MGGEPSERDVEIALLNRKRVCGLTQSFVVYGGFDAPAAGGPARNRR